MGMAGGVGESGPVRRIAWIVVSKSSLGRTGDEVWELPQDGSQPCPLTFQAGVARREEDDYEGRFTRIMATTLLPNCLGAMTLIRYGL